MRILVAVPVFHRYPQALESILALRNGGEPVDFLLMADDDPNDPTTVEGAYANITAKYNRARLACLSGGYDALLLAEDDMILPADTLPGLLGCEAGVAYGLTCWRHGRPGWSPRLALDDRGGVVNLSDYPNMARDSWGKVITVAGVGTFCTLIRREVLASIPFRLSGALPVCCDWWLAVDAERAGITQKANLGVVCGHISPGEPPRVIWPDVKEKRLWRMELLA